MSTNARHASLAPRIVQIRRPITAAKDHDFKGKSRLCICGHSFLRCILSKETTVYPVYHLTTTLLHILYAGSSQKVYNSLARGRRARQPRINTRGKSDLMHTEWFTCSDSYRCQGIFLYIVLFLPFPYSMCSCLRTPVFFIQKLLEKNSIVHRFGVELPSRIVDETFRTTEIEEIVEKGCDEATTTRTDDTDPIVVTKCERCDLHNIVINCNQRGEVVRTLRSIPNHGGHDARSEVKCGVDGVSCGPISTGTGLMWLRDLPVCISRAAPIPKMAKKITKGTRLGCNPLLRLIDGGKHDKNQDEGANELEWVIGDRISSMPNSSFGNG